MKYCCVLIALQVVLGIASLSQTVPGRPDGKQTPLTAGWLGQDGHDFTGPSPTLQGNDVQDVHIRVMGLPPDRRIASARLTGYGGGEWNYNGAPGTWRIAVQRLAGDTSADLYFDPGSFDTARRWTLTIKYDNGGIVNVELQGAATDPNRRMPNAAMQAVWLGQDGSDRTGPGPAVGPDGRQDVHIALTGLSAHVEIKSLRISVVGAPRGRGERAATGRPAQDGAAVSWEYGLNSGRLWNAELIRHPGDPGGADLFFSPDGNMDGEVLQLTLTYAPGQGDSTMVKAGPTDPNRAVPGHRGIGVTLTTLSAVWVGQDGAGPDRGDIHVHLDELPAVGLKGAELTDAVGGCWIFTSPSSSPLYAPAAGEEIPGPLPLEVHLIGEGRSADLFFPPFRNEASTRMTLRLVYAGGRSYVAQFAGGKCDPYVRGSLPAATAVTAHPGDDLSNMTVRYGTVHLTPGIYRLAHPLELRNAVTLSGEPGAVVEFSQAQSDRSLWQTAVQIGASNTTLAGFAIRFASAIRWHPEDDVNGAAVLGTLKPTPDHDDPGVNIVVRDMDIESSPMPSGVPFACTPRLMRLLYATSGQITHNVLKGGVCDVMHGPWLIADNDYRGTTPGAFTYDAFAVHYAHDVSVLRNTVHVAGPSGKTWRFLTMTQAGDHDIVTDNDVRDIGIRDDDTIPNPNAPEILLTEAYRLHFEGYPASIGSRGYLVNIPLVMGAPVRSGNVVAILEGPNAGAYFRIAQVISPTLYLMDAPLPEGRYAISVATGFVQEDFERNTIDMHGSSRSGDFVLAGNHYGTRVIGNRLWGGNDSLIISSTPTESPNIWGWSHAPMLGVVVRDNVLEDAMRGATIHVERDPAVIKSSSARVYMSVTLENNRVRWTEEFRVRHPGATAALHGYIRVGDAVGADPAECLLTASGNAVTESALHPEDSALTVVAAKALPGH